MIDKVDLMVPGYTDYTPQFSALYKQIRNDHKGPFRHSQHYLASADLSDYGYPVILHTHCRHGKGGNHKLELLDVGTMSYRDMGAVIQRVFATPPYPLRVMRVDLTVDVHGVPVAWFERNTAVQYKRWTSSIGAEPATEVSKMGSGEIETCYFGKRPNVFRVYNKIQERKNQYKRLRMRHIRTQGNANQFPSFEQLFGLPHSGTILTRVESEIGGGRVPAELATFGLLRNAVNFDPFQRLVFLRTGSAQPSPDDYDFDTYAKGMTVRQLVEELGLHRAKQFINRLSKRNANRILATYHEFLPSERAVVDSRTLLAAYQRSAERQLAA